MSTGAEVTRTRATSGFVQVLGSTIARNLDDSSGERGIQNYNGHVTIAGSILALNQTDCVGTIFSAGYNVIGNAPSASGLRVCPHQLNRPAWGRPASRNRRVTSERSR